MSAGSLAAVGSLLGLLLPLASGQTAPSSRPAESATTAATQPVTYWDKALQQDQLLELMANLRGELEDRSRQAHLALVKLGPPAAPALRRSMAVDAPVTRARAKAVLDELAGPDAAAALSTQEKATELFRQAKYVEAAELLTPLAFSGSGAGTDFVWLGHCYQLLGFWSAAADAYETAADCLEYEGFGDPAVPEHLPLTDPRQDRRTQAAKRQAALLLLAGRIRQELLKQPRTALEDFARGWRQQQRAFDVVMFECVQRQAALLEELGRPAEALAAWAELLKYPSDKYPVPALKAVGACGRLLAKLPPEGPLPELNQIIVLTPQQDSVLLKMDEQATIARAFMIGQPYFHFALAAPPGKEFASLQVSLDLEEFNARYGGQFSLKTVQERWPYGADLGGIGWDQQDPPQRKTVSKTFQVPAGAGMVVAVVGIVKDAFTVHSAQIKAGLRDKSQDASPPQPGASIGCTVEGSGVFTYNDKPLSARSVSRNLKPGPYTVKYVRDGQEAMRWQGQVLSGREYHFFINDDSPFRFQLTDLPYQGESFFNAGGDIVQLPGGEFLAVLGSLEEQLLISTSQDLKTWRPPVPLPGTQFFRNSSPTLFVAKDGTVWLCFASRRLPGLDRQSDVAGWLTSTRDGRRWSGHRLINGAPAGMARMTPGPGGKHYLISGTSAAVGDSPAEVSAFQPLGCPQVRGAGNSAGAWDGTHLHLAIVDAASRTLWLTRSKDGSTWDDLRQVAQAPENSGLDRPRLLVADGRLLIFYEFNSGLYVQDAPLADLSKLSKPLHITDHINPATGQPWLMSDGTLLLLAGRNTTWLMRCDVRKLLQPGQTPATRPAE
jgi:tetratricopeptide (TPR) repeat protein